MVNSKLTSAIVPAAKDRSATFEFLRWKYQREKKNIIKKFLIYKKEKKQLPLNKCGYFQPYAHDI